MTGKAIILRGPPGTGKTQISQEIVRRFKDGDVQLVNLDRGWGSYPVLEFRYVGGPGRYADIHDAAAPILVIELGCGEPPGLEFDGATRAASEWLDILKNAGREIHPFLLWAEWSDAVERLTTGWEAYPFDKLFWVWQQLGLRALYENLHPTASIPQLQETRLVTTGKSVSEATGFVLARSGL